MRVIKWCLSILFALLATHATAQDFDLDSSKQRGGNIYSSYCASCHMFNGSGITGVYTSLINDEEMMSNIPRLVKSVLVGVGDSESGIDDTHSFSLSDREVSDLLNYIRNSWGNEGDPVMPDDVQKALEKIHENED